MRSPQELSFLPDDYLERKAQRRANALCAVLFILTMGGIGAAFTMSEKATKKVDTEYSKIDQEYLGEAKRIEQVRQMEEKQKRMKQQADLTASLLEKVPRSFVLAELTNALPQGVFLLDFTLESKGKKSAATADQAGAGPQLTEYEKKKLAREAAKRGTPTTPVGPQPKIYDVYLKVSGIADTDVQVAQYLSRLSRSKLLKDVNLLVSEEHKDKDETSKMRKFQIEMMIDPEAEVQAAAGVAGTEVELK
jgi:Tfp pilus assembly protein PilN